MTQIVRQPPEAPVRPDGIKPAGWWHRHEDGRRIVCDLCPRHCLLEPGARGFCFVRQHLDGQLVTTTYGRSSGFCIDPIEKKPLHHFYPGSASLSFGTAGCNLGCKFCQNWSISKARQVDALCEQALPEQIAQTAQRYGCQSVSFTYNEPIIWIEYAIDTAQACRQRAVKTVAVTNGYISDEARADFFGCIDAANVDLKGFTEDFYWNYTSGHLQPVLDTLRYLVRQTQVWVEITNLIIPEANDNPREIEQMCQWIFNELGPEVPVHFTAFHPDFRMLDRPPTPPATLKMAYEIAKRVGLYYVYLGNVYDPERQSTYCPQCGQIVIGRDGYEITHWALREGCCAHCGRRIAGRFGPRPGDWGGRRQPVDIS